MFFQIVGAITTIVFVAITLWILYSSFIHPIFQALSIMRWLTACSLKSGSECPSLSSKWKFFKWAYEVGGVRTTRYSNNVGEWFSIGNWRLYESEDK